eukprot:m.204601 g.204601  ORF g.204601 m.204601 type:complete len:74 (+) comp16886_c2_seq5:252-473(+)
MPCLSLATLGLFRYSTTTALAIDGPPFIASLRLPMNMAKPVDERHSTSNIRRKPLFELPNGQDAAVGASGYHR